MRISKSRGLRLVPSRVGLLALGLGTCAAAPAFGGNVIVDHTNWDWYNLQPRTVAHEVATRKIFFAHASVGGNLLEGMADLHAADASKYPLVQVSVEGTPPADTSPGVIYEYPRGNPRWSAKIRDFSAYVRDGWHAPAVDLAMNKFCYIDQKANWKAYRKAMLALEKKYPDTRFVYWTMPLTTDSDANAVRRARFNQNLKNWIATQDGKILYDIADIEAWDPGGIRQTFTYRSREYPRLAPGYASDEGHLNQSGRQRAATALYSLIGLATAAGGADAAKVR